MFALDVDVRGTDELDAMRLYVLTFIPMSMSSYHLFVKFLVWSPLPTNP
jgi:hypothetical protein